MPRHTAAVSLPHALLTSLLERPCAGSDLARRFDSSIGFFWPATHQQIYRELGRMEAAGWVESTPEDTGRRKVYRCLPAGEAELRRWVAEGADMPQPPAVRDALLVRLRAEATLGPLGLEAQLRARLAAHESRLTAYEAIAERDFGVDLDHRGRRQRAILDAGISYERQGAQWCRETLAVLAADSD